MSDVKSAAEKREDSVYLSLLTFREQPSETLDYATHGGKPVKLYHGCDPRYHGDFTAPGNSLDPVAVILPYDRYARLIDLERRVGDLARHAGAVG